MTCPNLGEALTTQLSIEVKAFPPTSFKYSNTTYYHPTHIPFEIIPTFTGVDVVFSVIAGTLPDGLELNSENGMIFGIPTKPVTSLPASHIVIQAQNTAASITTTISIAILDYPILSYPSSFYVFKQNETVSISPLFEGSVPTFSILSGVLPTGLSFNTATGEIYGVPQAKTDIPRYIVIKLSNMVGCVNTTIVIDVVNPPFLLLYPQADYLLLQGDYFQTTPLLSGNQVTCSLFSGLLPAGLQLDSISGTISGIPESPLSKTPVTLTIRATNRAGSVMTTISMVVVAPPSNLTYSQSLFVIPCSTLFTATPSYQGTHLTTFPITFSIEQGLLPAGLVLDVNNGKISGIPEIVTPQVLTLTVRAMNAAGHSTTTIHLIVIEAPSLLTYSSSHYSISHNSNFTTTPIYLGYSPSFSIHSGVLPVGLQLDSETGTISGIPQILSSQKQTVVIMASNQAGFTTFSISFIVISNSNDFSYPQTTYVLSRSSPFSVHPVTILANAQVILHSGTFPSGLTLNTTTGEISGIPLSVVNDQAVIIRLLVAGNTNMVIETVLTFSILDSPTQFSYPQTLYILPINDQVEITPLFEGSSPQFAIVSGSLPTNLELHPTLGKISGIPTIDGVSTVVLSMSNALGILTLTLSFTILQPPSVFSYPQSHYRISTSSSSSSSPAFYCIPNIIGTHLEFSIQSGTLPPGLFFNTTSGMIFGNPIIPTIDQVLLIQASNIAGAINTTLTISTFIPISSFSYSQSSYTIPIASYFSIIPNWTGTNGLFTIISGSLPSNLVLNTTTGQIEGIPSLPSSSPSSMEFNIVVKLSNPVSLAVTLLSFTVITPPSAFSYSQTQYTLVKNADFSVLPIITGSALTYSIHTGALPTGIELDSITGRIFGIPTITTPNSQSCTIRAVNSAGSIQVSIQFSVLAAISQFEYTNTIFTIPINEDFSTFPILDGDGVNVVIQSGYLPSGLLIHSSNGVIYGKPLAGVSTWVLLLRAFNDVSEKSFSVTFVTQHSPTAYTPLMIPLSFSTGKQCWYSLATSGSNLTYSIVPSLPANLKLDERTGVLFGTPQSTVSISEYTVIASNLVGKTEVVIQLQVMDDLSAFSYSQTRYQFTIYYKIDDLVPLINGTDITFSLDESSMALPNGLQLDSETGRIFGKPDTITPKTTYQIKASNAVSSVIIPLEMEVMFITDYVYSRLVISGILLNGVLLIIWISFCCYCCKKTYEESTGSEKQNNRRKPVLRKVKGRHSLPLHSKPPVVNSPTLRAENDGNESEEQNGVVMEGSSILDMEIPMNSVLPPLSSPTSTGSMVEENKSNDDEKYLKDDKVISNGGDDKHMDENCSSTEMPNTDRLENTTNSMEFHSPPSPTLTTANNTTIPIQLEENFGRNSQYSSEEKHNQQAIDMNAENTQENFKENELEEKQQYMLNEVRMNVIDDDSMTAKGLQINEHNIDKINTNLHVF